ncbi:MAG: hypothetical protein ACHQT8_01515 [Chlamydiales bacterium]
MDSGTRQEEEGSGMGTHAGAVTKERNPEKFALTANSFPLFFVPEPEPVPPPDLFFSSLL